MIYYICLIISISTGILGQLSLKAGALHPASNLVGMLFKPYIFGGLFLYFIAALFYIYAIRAIPLSVAFPSVSLSYAIVAYLSHIIWGENFGIYQILALVIISIGICLLVIKS